MTAFHRTLQRGHICCQMKLRAMPSDFARYRYDVERLAPRPAICPLWASARTTPNGPEPTLAGRSFGEPENRSPLFLPTSRQTFVALASI